jgi:transposase
LYHFFQLFLVPDYRLSLRINRNRINCVKRIEKSQASWNYSKKLVGEVRVSNGRKEKNSFCIIDSQNFKNADTAEKGYDAGKHISGIVRRIAVDTQGLPHAIYVTTAEATGAVRLVENAKENLTKVKNTLVDAGYTGENFASQIKAIISATVEVIKRSELHTFVVLLKRWLVESSFAWLEKFRRLWKSCERKLNTSLQMIVFALISLLL